MLGKSHARHDHVLDSQDYKSKAKYVPRPVIINEIESMHDQLDKERERELDDVVHE